MNREEVVSALKGIFRSRLGIDFDGISHEALDKDLLGKEFNLMARDLVYIYFDIEKEFGIEILEEDIVTGRFSSFNNIAEIISGRLK